MVCKLCAQREKTWQGSDPKCAFDQNGIFTSDNWACATMSRLRTIADENDLIQKVNETSLATIYVPSKDLDDITESDNFDAYGGFIILSWYKGRGRVSSAIFMSDEGTMPLNIEHVKRAISSYVKG